MARKTEKKAKKVPQHPGRFLKGWNMDGTRWESYKRELDDQGVRRCGEAAKALLAAINEKSQTLATLKREIAEHRREEQALVRAMVDRREVGQAHVYAFADDESGTVSLYDAETDELLCVRPIDDHERQEEMELEGDADEDAED